MFAEHVRRVALSQKDRTLRFEAWRDLVAEHLQSRGLNVTHCRSARRSRGWTDWVDADGIEHRLEVDVDVLLHIVHPCTDRQQKQHITKTSELLSTIRC